MQQLHYFRQRFTWETRGRSIRILGSEFTPVSRITRVTLPGGGFFIHRPRAVDVCQGDTTQRYRIPNATRIIPVLLLLDVGVVALALGVRRWLVLERNEP